MMQRPSVLLPLTAASVALGLAFSQPASPQSSASAGAASAEAGMLRFPDVSQEKIVFVYANDLWLVPREGGVASPLASPAGSERAPKFSPDGGTIAFQGNYDGSSDLYTIAVAGGLPFRVTHHPAGESLSGWSAAGELIFSSSAGSGLRRAAKMYTVSAEGGLPRELSIPYGRGGALHSDGRRLAYTPNARDNRNWKRYRGGMATDIWLFDLEDKSSKQVTTWEGTDSIPMWQGDSLYYMSDAGPAARLNIWKFNPGTEEHTQVTHFTDFDIKWPSIGPGDHGQGEIVFQNNSGLFLLDLGSEESRQVHISVPGALESIRPRAVDVAPFLVGADISPSGKRVVVEARGDIWTLPAKDGVPRNLTRSSGVAERDPSWSPDGRWIAYFSDASGEYELTITQSDGRGETRALTTGSEGYRYAPTWSPDSSKIAFSDRSGSIYIHTIESGETVFVDQNQAAEWGVPVNWSHDGRWLTFTNLSETSLLSSVCLYDTTTSELRKVTSDMFNDSAPVFDRKGDYLYFASARDFNGLSGSSIDSSYIHESVEVILAVPLRSDIDYPWTPKSDEESWEDEDATEEQTDEDGDDSSAGDAADEDADEAEGEDADTGEGEDADAEEADGTAEDDESDGDDEPVEVVEIDLDGFERRAIALPIDSGSFSDLAVNDEGQLLFVRHGDDSGIKLFDLADDEREEKEVTEGSGFTLSGDGKQLLLMKGRIPSIGKAEADSKPESVSTDDMRATIDPREEWAQVYTEAWRLFRDYFYVANMHGVDWKAVHDQYRPMIDACATRSDVDYVIRETIAELNCGHTYLRGGPIERGPSLGTGLLGCDYSLENGAYRIARIIEGAVWDSDARGPLSQPGVDVHVGDYLLAVNGIAVDALQDPWAALVGQASKDVELTVSSEPTLGDEARRVWVKALSSEGGLRYRNWIETNRAHVLERSGGRVGYVYVPDTGPNGRNNFFRQFYGQAHLDALIIDERWNGGGFLPTREIEALNRPRTNYFARRWGRDMPVPGDSHQGPKCMLINRDSGSGGDMFPYLFKQAGLGKLIGTRTWGGLVGYSGSPTLIDGATVSIPSFGFYELDGSWGVEGHGVDPDIEVIDDPALMQGGADPQLDAAIAQMLEELESGAYTPPARPADPDRSGMGLPAADRNDYLDSAGQ